MEKDPVCGKGVDPAASQDTMEYQGTTYHFCSPACRRAFQADPSEYLGSK